MILPEYNQGKSDVGEEFPKNLENSMRDFYKGYYRTNKTNF